MWAKVPWTCLHSIIQHYLGSLQDPPLHKNCFILSLHENKFFGFEWEWPCRSQLPTETSPMAALDVLRLACRPIAAEGRVLVWTSTERGEGRSFAGSTLVLASGPRAWWRNPVCSSTKRYSVLAREETTVNFPRATVVGPRLHIERKPSADAMSPQGSPSGCLRENLEPTLRCRRVTRSMRHHCAPPRRL